ASHSGRGSGSREHIVVHPERQGSGIGIGIGIGRQLIEKLVELSRGHRKIILYAVPGREPLYEKFGFRRMNTAMAIFSDPDKARADGYIDGSDDARPATTRQQSTTLRRQRSCRR